MNCFWHASCAQAFFGYNAPLPLTNIYADQVPLDQRSQTACAVAAPHVLQQDQFWQCMKTPFAHVHGADEPFGEERSFILHPHDSHLSLERYVRSLIEAWICCAKSNTKAWHTRWDFMPW